MCNKVHKQKLLDRSILTLIETSQFIRSLIFSKFETLFSSENSHKTTKLTQFFPLKTSSTQAGFLEKAHLFLKSKLLPKVSLSSLSKSACSDWPVLL